MSTSTRHCRQMETFPLDIFTHIIEEIDSTQDHETLRSLSTCCHHLSPLCQRRIFRVIAFEISTWPTILSKLSRLDCTLKTSPHIGLYVRSVQMSFQTAMHRRVAPIYELLASILSKVHRLETMHLYWNSQGIGDWSALVSNTMCHQFCAQIHQISQTRNLIHLGIRYITHFPFDLVTTYVKVIDLTEADCYCVDVDIIERSPSVVAMSATDRSESPYPVVRNFSLGRIAWPRILSEIVINERKLLHTPPSVPPFDFTQVKYLSVPWDCENDRVQTEKILGNARMIHSFSLKVNLEVGFEGLSKMIETTALLLTMTTLSVEIGYPFRPGIETLSDPFDSLRKELSSLAPSNALQTLCVRIAFDTTIIDRFSEYCVKPLAKVLTQERFLRLRRARLECNIHLLEFQNAVSFGDVVGTDLSERLEKEFMDYTSIDALKFSCVVRIVD
ncbi:hypothetical protein M413DRAFT_26663 [Hebeloma cylindrosporum]|uniref:F-box domain-containing protein n=1 Tax=Hebeloma cylindrosporum TaxID=76867 RepID=A0A0C2YNR3_HEBCY|nr:hypothetical protein M413DRAFT_26663 [Hebeloma cylindrosporum h7]